MRRAAWQCTTLSLRKAEPDEQVATKGLDDCDAFAGSQAGGIVVDMGPPGSSASHFFRSLKLASTSSDAHPDARIDVAAAADRHLEALADIGHIGNVAPRVEIAAGGAADITSGGPMLHEFVADNAGGAGAILQRRRFIIEPHDFREMRLDIGYSRNRSPSRHLP